VQRFRVPKKPDQKRMRSADVEEFEWKVKPRTIQVRPGNLKEQGPFRRIALYKLLYILPRKSIDLLISRIVIFPWNSHFNTYDLPR